MDHYARNNFLHGNGCLTNVGNGIAGRYGSKPAIEEARLDETRFLSPTLKDFLVEKYMPRPNKYPSFHRLTLQRNA